MKYKTTYMLTVNDLYIDTFETIEEALLVADKYEDNGYTEYAIEKMATYTVVPK